MLNQSGTVFWLTGLSGSGKSIIGLALTKALRERDFSVLFLDGDDLREAVGIVKHDSDERLKAGFLYARLCKMIAAQGIHVVCATISLFHEIQTWNRNNIPNYLEIFIDVPLDELVKRDTKKIYEKERSGSIKNVVGIDITPDFPKKPDVIIHNYGAVKIEEAVALIVKKFKETRRELVDV